MPLCVGGRCFLVAGDARWDCRTKEFAELESSDKVFRKCLTSKKEYMKQTKELSKETTIALLREASMSSMAIGTGLTHIRQYDFSRYGFFYSGLLAFTAGIERLLKIILIYDYRLSNKDAFPNDDYLKRFRHKLDDLIEKARAINKSQSVNVDDNFFDHDMLYTRIVSCLTDFAIHARYYNLDYLVGRDLSGLEPLSRWDKEVCTEIVKRHYRPSKRRLALKAELGEELDKFGVSVKHMNEQGLGINTATSLLTTGDLNQIKQRYSMYYLYTVARFLSDLCYELESKGNFYPYLHEFFVIFAVHDKKHILRKKTWIPT